MTKQYQPLPPAETWIVGSWDGNTYITMRICKRRCCAYADGFNVVIPGDWRLATDEEAEKAADEAGSLVQLQHETISDLYE